MFITLPWQFVNMIAADFFFFLFLRISLCKVEIEISSQNFDAENRTEGNITFCYVRPGLFSNITFCSVIKFNDFGPKAI